MNLRIRLNFDTKLFIIITLLIALVVSVTTGRNIFHLKDSLTAQYTNTLADNARLVGLQINSVLSRWESKMDHYLPSLLAGDESTRKSLLTSFMKGEEGLQGVQILGADESISNPLTTHLINPILQPDSSLTKLFHSTKDLQILLHPAARSTGIMIKRTKSLAGKDVLWIVYFRLKSVLRTVDKSDLVAIHLLNEQHLDLLSLQEYSDIVDDPAYYQKSLSLLKTEDSGLLGEFSKKNKKFFAGMQKLPGYPLYLVAHLDGSTIQNAVFLFIEDMVQWALVFVLVGILFAKLITFNLVRNLHELQEITKEACSGAFGRRIPVRSTDEIGRLANSYNHMTQKLRELLESEKAKARLEQSLLTAQTVQNTFFKDRQFENDYLRITSYYKPASECGGDWWGRFSMPDGSELILIGDATGHGVPAALVTAIVYTTVHLHIQKVQAGLKSASDPAMILQTINQMLCKTLDSSYCMTFLALVMDPVKDQIIFSNAGHPYPVFIPASNSDTRLSQPVKFPFRFLIQKKKSSNILGMDPNTEFNNEVFEIKQGDRFIVFTDGLTEATDDKGKQWGNRGLQNFLKKNVEMDIQSLCDCLIKDITQFNAEADHFADDLTVVVIEFQKKVKALSLAV